MRTLRCNKIRIYYANYRDKVPLKDEYGNITGEYEIVYDNPIAIMANVSAAGGGSVAQYFGTQENYDRIIVLDFKDADLAPPITVSSILWIDTLPVVAEDGSTNTPHDYIVKRVATSLNSVSIAVSKVNVNHG